MSSILQEDITILNMYEPWWQSVKICDAKIDRTSRRNRWTSYHSWDFNTSLSKMDRSNYQKISKDIVEGNNTISQLNIMNIYRLFHSTTEYVFFSVSHGMFTKIDHILGHKKYLNNFKRIEIRQVSSQATVELNRKSVSKNNWKIPRYMEIKWTVLKMHGSKEKPQQNIKVFWTKWKCNSTYQNM